MSWVSDLASTAGIPAGAATLAISMYAACSAAEKAARPEALKEIGRVLKNRYWSHSAQPSVIIEQVFRWTFGRTAFELEMCEAVCHSHSPVRCFRRSFIQFSGY